MNEAAGRSDPRTIITPDAFSVAPELLNLPLARPWRRAAAILLDLLLVAILANVPAVFFAFAAGLFVFWLAVRSRRAEARGSTGRRIVRTTFGCLGAFTLVVAALAISAALFGDSDTTIAELENVDGRDIPVSAVAVSDPIRLARGGDSADVAAAAVDADTLELDSLAARWAAARAAGDSAGMARFGPRLGAELAADELEERASEVRRLEGRIERLEDDLDETEAALEQERDRGILASVYALLDDIGLSLGWAGLYFTFFLGWWKGRTPGKRLLGIRVVRLDGRPLGYWIAFERYGGYAASLFTGLEGFARIFWDPNRQALEDRLAGTVVVRETPEVRERLARLHERSAPAA